MPKVHKLKEITPFRPTNSQCGSLFALISKYIDYYLHFFATRVPSYLRDSDTFLERIKKLDVPESAVLFTSDAEAMYTNIDPEDGIEVVYKYMQAFKHEVKEFVPIPLLIKLLALIMMNNVFAFGNTYWKQLIGTAMGTPCAVNYTTIYFGWFERTDILPTFKSNILMYGRLVDDIGCVWDMSGERTFNEFDEFLNSRCKLVWGTTKPKKSMNFLDLHVWINGNRICTSTYQKEISKFPYIPGNSAHPAGLAKGLVCGLMERYWKQNSYKRDFQKFVSLLFERLIARSHKREDTVKVFKWASAKIKGKLRGQVEDDNQVIKKSSVSNKNLFFHLKYHPKDISRQKIQDIYEKTCATPDADKESLRSVMTHRETRLNIEGLTVAYSRPKNLRDCLVQSRLVETSEINVETSLRVLKKESRGVTEEAAHG